MELRDRAIQLDRLLRESSWMWEDARDPDGVSRPRRVLLTQLLELIGDANPSFVVGYSRPSEAGAEIDCVVLTNSLLLRATASAGEEPVVEVRARRAIRSVAILTAPNLALPCEPGRPDRTPWSIRVDVAATSVSLPLRDPSPAQLDAVRALLPALLADVSQGSTGSTPQSHIQ